MLRHARLILCGAILAAHAGPANAVVIGEENRQTLTKFAQTNSLNTNAITNRYAATGLLDCGRGIGTAQLTASPQVITTAAHVIFGSGSMSGMNMKRCTFKIRLKGQWQTYKVIPESLITGSFKPMREHAAKDWAVLRLTKPVRGVRPYSLGSGRNSGAIHFVAHDHHNWRPRKTKTLERCNLRGRIPGGASNQVGFDCDAGRGASGSALLSTNGRSILGIYVGYKGKRGRDIAYGSSHYNYALKMGGAFANAVRKAARQ